MNEELVETIRFAASALDKEKDELKRAIRELQDPEGKQFAFDRILPGQDFTLDDIFAGLTSLLGLVSSIDVKENAPFVPKALLTQLHGKLADIKSNFENLRNLVANVTHGVAKTLDVENFNVTTRNDNVHSFSKAFRSLFANLDAAYVAWYQVRFVLRAPKLAEFSKYVSEFENSREQVANLVNAVTNLRQAGEQKQLNRR